MSCGKPILELQLYYFPRYSVCLANPENMGVLDAGVLLGHGDFHGFETWFPSPGFLLQLGKVELFSSHFSFPRLTLVIKQLLMETTLLV